MEMSNQSNWELETITKYTLDIILLVDKNRKAIFSTPSVTEIFGFTPEELTNKDVFDMVHPDDRENLMEKYKKSILTQQPTMSEYRVFDQYGNIRYFESKTTPIPDSDDLLAVVAVRDITDRKMMELELQKRKNRYEELQKSLKNFSQDLSSVMKVSDLKSRLLQELYLILPSSDPHILMYQRENHKIEGDLFLEVESYLPSLSVGKLETIMNKFLIKIGDRMDSGYVIVLNADSIYENMETIWLETLVYYVIMVFEGLNVIENLMNQLETAIQSKETPQWILRLLFNLSEKQRLDLSSDLHDTVLQDQIDLYRRLESLLNRYEIDQVMKDQLKGIEQGLLDTIHQIRMTCNELRPPLLREMGLVRALENLFDYTQVSSTYKIVFTIENQNGLTLNEEQTIGIYRIVQELLNNATKHSRAAMLTFHMSKQDEGLMLIYSDDGVGFELDKWSPSFNNMGLSSMRQRVQSLNGEIEYNSQLGSGLRVTVRIPITSIGT